MNCTIYGDGEIQGVSGLPPFILTKHGCIPCQFRGMDIPTKALKLPPMRKSG